MDDKPILFPANLIRKIRSKAPSFTYGERADRYPGRFTEGGETARIYKNVIIYVQNGLADKTNLFYVISKAIFKIQNSKKRKFRLFVFGFGNSDSLQEENKYYDFYHSRNSSDYKEVSEAISRISGINKVKQAIITELFPKSKGKYPFDGRTKVNEDDLLIVIGKKDEVCFHEDLKSIIKTRIRKHILLIEIEKEDIDYIFYPKEINYL